MCEARSMELLAAAAADRAARCPITLYTISDQDNTGPWIRRHWPQLFYIASVHQYNIYALAAWNGMSGENYYYFEHVGSNTSVISKEWVKKHIHDVGELGAQYPTFDYIPEGESSFLSII